IGKDRYVIECLFQRLKRFRRIKTRYDRLAATFMAFVYLSALADWCRSLFCPHGLIPGTVSAEVIWVSGADGNWGDLMSWLEKDSDPPVNRLPEDGEWIRPRVDGITITYSESTGLQDLGGSTIWQDSSATTGFLQTGGDLTVNQVYLAKLKSNDAIPSRGEAFS
ncbi:MAG: hypothetical protein ACON38_02845, partial [Akkermansiaceae bacterium]